MRKVVLTVFFLIWFLPSASLFAAGKTEKTEPVKLNNEWMLCVTAFDSSTVPVAGRIISDVVSRNFVDLLKAVSYRIRLSPEYTYYEDYAWTQSLSVTAKALSAKQDERSLLLYRGEKNWKYLQNLKKIDADIAKLREEFAKKEAEKPLINSEPKFTLSQENRNGTFPAPPQPGGEYRFCQSQKVDAFLTASLREFHGRYYINLKLYTLYTRSYIYEDDIIFSTDDANGAVDEIAGRLMAVLSGSRPAAIAVHTEPAEAMVLVNQTFAGRGDVPAMDHPPGKLVLAVSADSFQPHLVETELIPGELADISIQLAPLLYGNVDIEVPGKAGVSVYQGALYVGEAPLTLRLPIGQLEYVSLDTKGGQKADAVFSSPDMPDMVSGISLQTKQPPPSGQRRVNKARGRYYWAWGGTWITGIVAWITYGIYSTQVTAARQSSNPDFIADTERMYYISGGAIVLVGTAVAYEFFQMARYLYTATEDATPIVKQDKKKE